MYRIAYLLTLIMCVTQSSALHLPAIFSDHMVLQQKTVAAFWGTADANEQIKIATTWGGQAETVADAQGHWLVKVKTPQAGGPYVVTITGAKGQQTFQDVLIGEVWLCSGQSNMEMPLQGWPPNDLIENSQQAIVDAQLPTLRLFTVARSVSHVPSADCQGTWATCTPEAAKTSSATAFFFGRKLHADLGIPVGLIHSSWGGTPVQAWTSAEYLATIPEYRPIIENIYKSQASISQYEEWQRQHPKVAIAGKASDKRWQDLEFNDQECGRGEYPDQNWPTMSLPQNWEKSELGVFDGAVWFRKDIDIPADWSGRDAVLELGPIDDMDRAYFNGMLIGQHEQDGFWNTERKYAVPGHLIKAGKNTIAVRVVDNQGNGGLFGKPEQLTLHLVSEPNTTIRLDGIWKYQPIAEYKDGVFYIYDRGKNEYLNRPKILVSISPLTPTFLYNAMIAPLVPFAIKGAIWYQGESNTGEPLKYRTLFPLMIKNWRQDWGRGEFPFYYVQIAPFEYGETPSQELREAQMLSMKVPHAGMAVTLDIGDARNIHPGKKQEVGERLALWALAKDYKKKLTCSGPIFKRIKIEGDRIRVSFDYAGTGLAAGANGLNGFEIAGPDKKYHPAQVEIQGKQLLVQSDLVKSPVAVRYAWSNTASASLFNKEGLPASSFRSEAW
jgi:sialate O-acetylesterase